MIYATFVQDGRHVDYTPLSDVAAGTVVVQGELVGITTRDIPANTLGSLAVEGIFDIQTDGTVVNTGVKAYWLAAQKVATGSDGGGANKYLGKLVRPFGDGSTVRIRLSQ